MMPPCRRLRRQLAALQSSAAAPPTPPPLALPLEAIEPEREVDGAALQYQRSGYTIVRDIVPAPLLRELQGRFEEHTADYHREHGEQGRFELEALREDEVFGRLASLLTEHPVVQRVADVSWLCRPVIDHKPYGSVHYGGVAADGSWHTDSQGPLPRRGSVTWNPAERSGPQWPDERGQWPERSGLRLMPFMMRASVLLDTVTDDMGPTRERHGLEPANP